MERIIIYGLPGTGLSLKLSGLALSLGLDAEERPFAQELEHWASGYNGLTQDQIDQSISVLAVYWSSGELPIVWVNGHALDYSQARDALAKMSRERLALN